MSEIFHVATFDTICSSKFASNCVDHSLPIPIPRKNQLWAQDQDQANMKVLKNDESIQYQYTLICEKGHASTTLIKVSYFQMILRITLHCLIYCAKMVWHKFI